MDGVAGEVEEVGGGEAERGGDGVFAADRGGDADGVVGVEGDGDLLFHELADRVGPIGVYRAEDDIAGKGELDGDAAVGHVSEEARVGCGVDGVAETANAG